MSAAWLIALVIIFAGITTTVLLWVAARAEKGPRP